MPIAFGIVNFLCIHARARVRVRWSLCTNLNEMLAFVKRAFNILFYSSSCDAVLEGMLDIFPLPLFPFLVI